MNVMVEGRKSFEQPVKDSIRTCENIRKTKTGTCQGHYYIINCLLDYPYFK